MPLSTSTPTKRPAPRCWRIKAALDAGADAIDLSLAPCSGGTCQPDVIVMWHALRGSDYTLDVDIEKVREAEEVFKECMQDYFLPPEAVAVEPLIPWSPMPGGALTANTQMMRDNGIMDKYPELIKAMSDVVRRGGYGTSVTPVSQFYVQQALNNVMFGPWEKIAEPYGKMVLGYFGKTPVPPDAEIVKIASEQLELEPTTRSPLEINDEDPTKGVAPARQTLKEHGLAETDENIFIVAACKDKGLAFLQGEATVGVRKVEKTPPPDAAERDTGQYVVTVDGRDYRLALQGDQATVNGKVYQVGIRAAEAAAPAVPASVSAAATPVRAEMPGVVLRFLVQPGTAVNQGDGLLVVEAMKMEVRINAPTAGTVAELAVNVGDHVATGQTLVTLA